MYHYRNVSASAVNSELRVAAEMAVVAAVKELNLGPVVTIQWYEAVSSAGESDWSADRPEKGHSEALSSHRIWLNVDQDTREVMTTAAHEIKHVAQFQDGSLPKYGLLITKDIQRSTEREAESFGQAIAYRLSNDPTPTHVLYRHEPDEGASLFKQARRLLRML